MENLTQQEKYLIKQALYFVYDTKLDRIRKHNKIMTEDEKQAALKTASMYFDLTDKIK